MWQVEARRGKASRRCIEPPEHDVADPETSWHYYCKCTKTLWHRTGPCETVLRIATFRNRAEPCGTVQNRAKPCRTVRNRAEPCATASAPCETVRAPCGTVGHRAEPCRAVRAPCRIMRAPCGAVRAPCGRCGTMQGHAETTWQAASRNNNRKICSRRNSSSRTSRSRSRSSAGSSSATRMGSCPHRNASKSGLC